MSYYRSWKHTSLTFCCCCWGTGRHPILWQSGALMPDFNLGVSSMKNWGLFHPLISWAHSLLNSSFSFLYPGELYSSVGSESTGIATAKHTSGSISKHCNFFLFCSPPDYIHSPIAWTHAWCILFISWQFNNPLKPCWLLLLPLSLQLPPLWESRGRASRICLQAGTHIPPSLHSTCSSDI